MKKSVFPNALTLMNLFCGFVAIYRMTEQRFEEAVWLLALALIFDSLDGNVARIFKVSSELGKELDSLGDIVSFVVAPSLYILTSWNYPLHAWMMLIIFAYLGAGTVRLATFNINTVPVVHGFFSGLPTPASSVLAVMLASGLQQTGWLTHAWVRGVYYLLLLGLAVLMSSRLPYPKITVARFRQWWGIPAVTAPLFLFVYHYGNPQLAISVAFLIYVLSGLFKLIPFSPNSHIMDHHHAR